MLINVGVSVKMKRNVCKNGYIWNPSTCTCQNRYAVSISDDSVVKSDEITEKTKTGPTKSILTNAVQVNFNEKKTVTCKTKNFYILLVFLSITIALLIAVSIYLLFLIKYQAKQNHLPHHTTNSKLEEVLY